MSNVKTTAKATYALSGVTAAAVMLVMSAFSGMGIISIVYKATGWKMPSWLAWVLVGIGAAGAVISLIASFGVTLPYWVAVAVAGTRVASS